MIQELLDAVVIEPEQQAEASIIWMHGLGADGHDFEAIVPELQLPKNLHIRFIFPHAPVNAVTINGGMRMRSWYDIKSIELDRIVDHDQINESSKAIEKWIEKEIEKGISSDRILLAGFSQGGVIALHTALRYKKKLAGIMALSTYLPSLEQVKNERTTCNAEIPIFIAHGTMDPVISIQLSKKVSTELKQLNYSISWHEYPMMHAVCPDEIRHIQKFIIKVFN